MKKSLYQITKEVMEIASLLEEEELTEDLENQLVISQTELQEKAINYGYAIKSIEDDIEAVNNEIKRLQAIKKSKESAIDRMKFAVSQAMQLNAIEKITSPTLNLSFRVSESVEVYEVDLIPANLKTIKQTVSPDKYRIKQAIKDGKTVNGAKLITTYNLQIK